MVLPKVCDMLTHLLDNICYVICTKLYRQAEGISMGTYRTPLVDALFPLYYYDVSF